jgi:hypothetical protein
MMPRPTDPILIALEFKYMGGQFEAEQEKKV